MRIAKRSKRSVYSYLFYPWQYSKFFELAIEEFVSVILDEEVEGVVDNEPLPEMPRVDLSGDNFDPFNLGLNSMGG